MKENTLFLEPLSIKDRKVITDSGHSELVSESHSVLILERNPKTSSPKEFHEQDDIAQHFTISTTPDQTLSMSSVCLRFTDI